MRKLIFKTDHSVSYFDYHNSLCQLLLRSSYWDNNILYNLDILFVAVQVLQTKTCFNGLELYEGDVNDIEALSNSEENKLYFKVGLKLFVLISEGNEHFIIAGFVKIGINTLPNRQTSIEMKKDWYVG